jgi:hypothetical protein
MKDHPKKIIQLNPSVPFLICPLQNYQNTREIHEFYCHKLTLKNKNPSNLINLFFLNLKLIPSSVKQQQQPVTARRGKKIDTNQR